MWAIVWVAYFANHYARAPAAVPYHSDMLLKRKSFLKNADSQSSAA
jgi:hypothetical protein